MASDRQHGFVLPYVLIVIAVLSLSVMIIAQRIQNTSNLLSLINSKSRADLAFASAEAEVTYSILTATPVSRGMDLNPPEQLTLVIDQETGNRIPDIWLGNGGQRVSYTHDGNVYITYRDIAGFISLNVDDIKLTNALVKGLGASSAEAQNLSAKLNDFIDGDNNRQFRGGERADYRLRNLLPPTNSPIRQYEELYNVMGWPEFLDKISKERLADVATLNKSVASVKRYFMPGMMAQQLDSYFDENKGVTSLINSSHFPAETGRFKLEYQAADGAIVKRAVEIERKIAAVNRPYARFFVYETITKNNDSDANSLRLNGLKHVIHAETYRIQ